MLSDYIKVGDRVEISVKHETFIDKGYMSLVESIINKNELDMDVPVSYGRLVMLKPGEGYQLLFFTDNGSYVYDAEIERYFKSDGFNLMRVRTTSIGEKKQRREFFRYECKLPLNYSIARSGAEQSDYTCNTGLTLDISGGGLRFTANEQLREGDKITCAFSLDNSRISVNAKVLYSEEINIGSYKYEYRVQFVRIPLADQEKIVQYVAVRQRNELNMIYTEMR